MRKRNTEIRLLRKKADALWRERVFEFWGERCTACGASGVEAHHFIPKSKNGLLRYDILNGVPLCVRCHWNIHHGEKKPVIDGIYARRGFAWRQYIEERERMREGGFKNKMWYMKQISILEHYEMRRV